MIPVYIQDVFRENWLTVQKHPKYPSKGVKKVLTDCIIFIEDDDAKNLVVRKNATFINWGNLKIIEINKGQDGNIVKVQARLNLEDKDYKNTLKITWVAQPSHLLNANTDKKNSILCYTVYFDHIISIPLLGKDDDFKDFVANDTRVIILINFM